MSAPASTPQNTYQTSVLLDGKPVALAGQNASSLTAVRAHLEILALCQQRILFSLTVDGMALNLGDTSLPSRRFKRVVASTISFDQLRFQLLRAARKQVEHLKSRVEGAVLLALINDWPVVQRCWWDLLPDLKEPLVTLSFCTELFPQPPPLPLSVFRGRVIEAEHLGRLLSELESICEQRDGASFSDALEQRLLPWLEQLDDSLARFNETSPS